MQLSSNNLFLLVFVKPGASSTKTALDFLLTHELVYRDPTRGYIVYDRFMSLWLKRLFGGVTYA